MKSLLEKPWAIVVRGGSAPGHRRPTRIAFLVEKTAAGYMGYLRSNTVNGQYTKSLREIAPDTILARFPHQPAPRFVRRFVKDHAPIST